MGAIKFNDYSEQEWKLSILARALAHPARIQMITTLRRYRNFRNIDFARQLNMSPSTINDHIEKLKDAGLIAVKYYPHYYRISLNRKELYFLSDFILESD